MKTQLLALALATTPIYAQQAVDATQVTKQLDMDGAYFMYSNMDGDLAKIARLANDWMATARKNGNKKVPEGLDANQLLKLSGLDQISAYGRSAKHMGDHWVSKMFIHTGGSNQGLLSLSGAKAAPYQALKFAPQGSDFAMEMHLDLSKMDDMMKDMSKQMDKDCQEKMSKWLKHPIKDGFTVGDMVNQLNMRMSVIAKLDDKKRVTCPVHKEYNFPETHFCARIEGAQVIWKEFSPMAGFMFKIDKQANGDIMLQPLRMKKEWGDKKPVMLIQNNGAVMWAASSDAFLKECLGNGPKLAADPAYKAISGNATSGNAMAYLSRQACLELRQVTEAKMKKRGRPMFSAEYSKFMLDHVTESKNGYFASATKTANGIQYILKAPCPIKDMMGGHHGKKGHKKHGKSSGKCPMGYDKKSRPKD